MGGGGGGVEDVCGDYSRLVSYRGREKKQHIVHFLLY